MELLWIIPIILFIIIVDFLQSEGHKRKIHEHIASMGGTIIQIEKRYFSTGPFMVVGRGRTVYKIDYLIDNEVKEGWVRFGVLSGPNWRL